LGRQAESAADFDKALELDPGNDRLASDVALVLATPPEEGTPGSKGAIESARRACVRSGWRRAADLEALAAAYAEAGQFPKAVKYQRKALACPDLTELQKETGRQRLKRCEQGRPFREK
jgi:tetratricopeptide (TPR) repeat protein